MTAWTSEELNKIDSAEELQIVSLRKDVSLPISPVLLPCLPLLLCYFEKAMLV